MNCDASQTSAEKSVISRRAFTIVEVMIVILVVGILLAVAIPNYKKSRERSRIKRAEVALEMIANAVRQLKYDTGKWPNGILVTTSGNSTEVEDLTPSSVGLIAANSTYTSVGWRGPYLRKIDRDPWGRRYWFDPDYTYKGVVRFAVGSYGPNGVGLNMYDSDDILVILQ